MHRTLGVTAFAVLALVAGDAAAQWSSQPNAQTAQQQAQPQNQPQAGQSSAPSAASDHVVGKTAMSPQGKEIGTIKDVLVTQDGKVDSLIVNHGGAAGVGAKQVAIGWDKVTIKGDQLTVNMTDQEVGKLPEYKGD